MKQDDPGLEVVSVRLVRESPILSPEKIKDPETAIRVMGEVFKELDREVVGIINLKTDGTPINCHIASMGSLNTTVAEPRELMKASILSNAASIIMIHNHPSADLYPSVQDIAITDRMSKVCSLIGIHLLDHVIVGGENQAYFSFREKGMVSFQPSIKYAEDIQDIQLGNVAERSRDQDGKVHGGRTCIGKKR